MANPNMLNVTSIKGYTIGNFTGLSFGTFLENPTSSGKVLKITNLTFTSNGSSTTTQRLWIYDQNDSLVVSIFIAPIPLNTTVVIVSKDTAIYLTEGQKIKATTDIHLMCSYEEIS